MTFSQIGPDGGLETYPDPFRNVSMEDVQFSDKLVSEILTAKSEIEVGFMKLALCLDQMERDELYKAQGFESFRAWVESPEIEISYRTARDLIRIRRELLPRANEQLLAQAGVSKARALLPLLHENESATLILLERAPQMTWRDLRNEVKRARGIEPALDQGYAVVFKANGVQRRGDFMHVRDITGMDGNRIHVVCRDMLIPIEWWPRWSSRFGDFIEFTEADE